MLNKKEELKLYNSHPTVVNTINFLQMDSSTYASMTYCGVLCHIFVVNPSFKTGHLTRRVTSFSVCGPKIVPSLAATASKIILLVFTLLSCPLLLLFIDPTNIYRVYIAGISQTHFPQEPDH